MWLLGYDCFNEPTVYPYTDQLKNPSKEVNKRKLTCIKDTKIRYRAPKWYLQGTICVGYHAPKWYVHAKWQ